MVFTSPGAYVEEHLLALQAPQAQVDASAVAVFVGSPPRGPVTPTLSRSWSDYSRDFGGFDGDNPLPFALYSYFQNGGRAASVMRVLGTGAVTATRVLDNAAGDDALRVSAPNPGVWGNDLSVDVTAATTGRFNITVTLDGVQVDRFADLSMEAGDRRYAPDIINRSAYLVAEAMGSTATGANSALVVQAATALTTGANGEAPTDVQINAAQAELDKVNAPMVVNLLGTDDADIVNSWTAWAEDRQNAFVVIDAPLGLDPEDAADFFGALVPTTYAAAYYPGIIVTDPSSRVPGARRLIPVGGAIVGQYANTDATRGVFKAPAGLASNIVGAVALERQLTNAEYDALNGATIPVNPLKVVPGTGVVIYGAKTLKRGNADKYVPVRRTLIYLRDALLDLTRFAVFEPNDAELWENLRVRAGAFLQDFYQQGGLRGNTPAQAYFVKCDGELNGRTQIENGEVHLQVGVSLQYPAEFVVISLGQFEGGSTVSDTAA